MTAPRSLAENLGWRSLAQAVSGVLSAVLAAWILRHYAAAAYGDYFFAAGYAALFAIGADLGLHLLLTRELAKGIWDRGRLIGTVLWVKAGLGSVTLALLVLSSRWVRGWSWEEGMLVGAAGLAMAAQSLVEATLAVANGFERLDLSAKMGVGYRVVTLAAAGVVMAGGGSPVHLFGGFAAAGLLSVFINLGVLRGRLAPFPWTFDAAIARFVLREGWPIALSGLFTALYFRMDAVLLAAFHEAAEVGRYGAAYKWYEVSMAAPAVVAAALMPVIARSTQVERRALIGRTLGWMMGGGMSVALVGAVWPAEIMRVLGGASWDVSAPLFRVLAAAMPFMFLHFIAGAALIGMGRQRSLAGWTALCAVASVAAYRWWIPAGGAEAAAWITLATDIAVCAGSLGLCWQGFREPEIPRVSA